MFADHGNIVSESSIKSSLNFHPLLPCQESLQWEKKKVVRLSRLPVLVFS